MKALTYYLFLPFLYLFSLLPFWVLYGISDGISWLIYSVIKYRREVVWSNLKNSFPEKSETELQIIEKEFYGILTDYIIESVKCLTISKKNVLSRGKINNSEVFKKYNDKKQNIIVTLGHVGSQELLNLFASSSPDFYMNVKVVYRPLNNPYFEKLFRHSRERFGSMLSPMNEAYKSIARQEEGRPFVFLLVNDQAAPPEKAYWTQFLHQDTCFFQGAELFARQYDMPVIFANISRPKRGHFAVDLVTITEHPREEPINYITETHARLLEKNIVDNPPIWLWSHKRWKHKRRLNSSVEKK